MSKDSFMPAEVASSLHIGVSTLRKYSLLLEESGMTFDRNTQNSRLYKEIDVIALQRMITLMKEYNVTVENAALTVAKASLQVDNETTDSDAIHNAIRRHNDDIAGVTLSEVQELKCVIQKQSETIEAFRATQEKRDQYFLKILEDLNEEVQQLKQQRELPDAEEAVKTKSLFARIFGRQ